MSYKDTHEVYFSTNVKEEDEGDYRLVHQIQPRFLSWQWGVPQKFCRLKKRQSGSLSNLWLQRINPWLRHLLIWSQNRKPVMILSRASQEWGSRSKRGYPFENWLQMKAGTVPVLQDSVVEMAEKWKTARCGGKPNIRGSEICTAQCNGALCSKSWDEPNDSDPPNTVRSENVRFAPPNHGQ